MPARELTLGKQISAAREAAGLTVEQVSATTMIRAGLLRQIEADQFEACGGAVYIRGHLRAIATSIGADAGEFVSRYDREHSPTEPSAVPIDVLDPDPIALRDLRERRGTQWHTPMAVALGVVTLIAGVAYFSPTSRNTPSAVASDLPTVPTTAPSASSAPATHDTLAFSGVTLRVRAHGDRSWLSVKDARGSALFQGVLEDGASKDFHSPQGLVLVIGNAGAVDFVVNGKPVAPAGAAGQVKTVSFQPNGSIALLG